MWTNSKELQDLVVPKEMSLQDIIHAKQNLFALQKMNFVLSDVELHAANGYLLEEFYRLLSYCGDDCRVS
jgi:N-ethylmaleimide reductase